MRNVLLTVIFTLCTTTASAQSATRHVPTQYSTIQAAIDASQDGDTVMIIPGTYKGLGNRDIDFGGKKICVRSMNPDDPNIVEATVIDCEGTETDKHRGFYFQNEETEESVVSGITIKGGYHDYGGAINIKNSSPGLYKNRFISNQSGFDGAAIYVNQASEAVEIQWNTFTGNLSHRHGGSIVANKSQVVHITDNVFLDNVATEYAGAVHLSSVDSCILKRNEFHANIASFGNGGAADSYSSEGLISDNVFTNNSALLGGALSFRGYSNFQIKNNTISQNEALSGEGGGIYANYSMCYILNNMILENKASSSGGGMWFHWSPVVLKNNLIQNNQAPENGTAMGGHASTVTAVNNIVSTDPCSPDLNTSVALIKLNFCTVWLLVNNIIWGQSPSFSIHNRSQVHMYYSNTADGYLLGQNGNISADPSFNPDFSLKDDSPCKYTGHSAFVDEDGTRCDIGLFGDMLPSIAIPSTLYVNQTNENGPWSGSLDQPYRYIWEALWVASPESTIYVAPGTYYENPVIYKHDIRLIGTGIEQTVLDGQMKGQLIQVHDADGFEISGFTLTQGYGAHGGALTIGRSQGVSIHDNLITKNRGIRYAGGIMVRNQSQVEIQNNVITYNDYGNVYPQRGGGIIIEGDASADIIGNLISYNRINGDGGGIWANGDTIIQCNTIMGNYAGVLGGGMLLKGDNMVVENNLICGNKAIQGAGIYLMNCSIRSFKNLTITENLTTDRGGGMMADNSSATLMNTIIWNNRAENPSLQMDIINKSQLFVFFSDIPDGIEDVFIEQDVLLNWGFGNIQDDPLFVQNGSWDQGEKPDDISDDIWTEGDYHLQYTSPCLNAGDFQNELYVSQCDIDGESRVAQGRIDIGADEYQ